MAGSVNKAIIVGNVGRDPEIRQTQAGDKIANLSVATSESWLDKSTGQRKEVTEWHRVVIYNQNIVRVCDEYVRKGTKVYIEGQIKTRKWQDSNGIDRYATEIVLQSFGGALVLLSSKEQEGQARQPSTQQSNQQSGPVDELEDEIPF